MNQHNKHANKYLYAHNIFVPHTYAGVEKCMAVQVEYVSPRANQSMRQPPTHDQAVNLDESENRNNYIQKYFMFIRNSPFSGLFLPGEEPVLSRSKSSFLKQPTQCKLTMSQIS